MNKYFDNAATSFPKPPQVAEEIAGYLADCGGTYGRAAYDRVMEASSMVERCRGGMADLLGVQRAENVIFNSGATLSMNAVIKCFPGMEDAGSGFIVWLSPMEHNAVTRVLSGLRNLNIRVLPFLPDGTIDMDAVRRTDKRLFAGSPVCINHQSNVNGVIQPMDELADYFASWGDGSVFLILDASQSLGSVPVKSDEWNTYATIFSGHKGLLGPTGIGGWYGKDGASMNTFVQGGTGSNSESFEMPEFTPDRHEAGTPNMVGIVGLSAAIGNPPLPRHTDDDWLDCMDELSLLEGVHIYKAMDRARQGNVLSFTSDSHSPSSLAAMLFDEYGIEVRSGLHCAPLAHKTLGTFPTGTVRVSSSPYHTPSDFEYLIKAIADVSR